MKTLLLAILFIPCAVFSQPKWSKITKNDLWVMGMEVGAGYAKGWADQIEFHHYAMTQQFPSLFKNGNKFWDGRYDADGIWDAKHMSVAISNSFHIAAICIKVGDIKSYKRKDRWKKIAFDALKYYAAYHVGFFLSYNLTHKNPIFK